MSGSQHEHRVEAPPGSIVARDALIAAAAVYGAYAAVGWLGLPGDLRYVGLVAGFYFLPGWLLRRDPDRQARYQVGPQSVLPPWRWAGARWAAVAALAVFPVFIVGFWGFYASVCPQLSSAPTDGESGSVVDFVGRLCRAHAGEFLPSQLRIPSAWTQWFGLGGLFAVVVEVFAVALPEEVFHRGYLMSALEERWPPRFRVFGVPLGRAAVLSSAIFAVGHLVGMAETARLATFFPALLFSWLWRKSDSLWAPALFHAAANLLMAILMASTFPG